MGYRGVNQVVCFEQQKCVRATALRETLHEYRLALWAIELHGHLQSPSLETIGSS